MKYNTCPYCGANLDPGEKCDCREEDDEENQKITEISEKEKTEW